MYPMLDESVSDDHPLRRLDEILRARDLPASLERTEEAFEKRPEKALVDAGLETAANLGTARAGCR